MFGASADVAAAAVGAQQKQPRQFDPDQDLAQAEKRQKQQVQQFNQINLQIIILRFCLRSTADMVHPGPPVYETWKWSIWIAEYGTYASAAKFASRHHGKSGVQKPRAFCTFAASGMFKEICSAQMLQAPPHFPSAHGYPWKHAPAHTAKERTFGTRRQVYLIHYADEQC